MEQGPVLIVTFVAQQIIYVEDTSGKVIEGDKVRNLLSSDLKTIIIKISFLKKQGQNKTSQPRVGSISRSNAARSEYGVASNGMRVASIRAIRLILRVLSPHLRNVLIIKRFVWCVSFFDGC